MTTYVCVYCQKMFNFYPPVSSYDMSDIRCNWCGRTQTGGGILTENKNKNTKGNNTMAKNRKGSGHGNNKAGAHSTTDFWEVEVDCVEQCSKAPVELIAFISVIAKVKIDALMKKLPNIEWFAYLLGEKDNDNFVINDIHVPKQTITATSVTDVICPEYNQLPVIGAIHSHHGMGNGFSGHDHEFVNGNHNLSLVIASNGIAGQARWTTPCDALKIVPVKVKPKFDVDFDEKSFLEDSMPKLQERSYKSTYTSNTYTYQPPVVTGKGKGNTSQTQYSGHGSIKEAANKGNVRAKEKEVDSSDDQELADALEEAFRPM